jgi:chromate transporter
MAPVVIGLLLAMAWILAGAPHGPHGPLPQAAMVLIVVLLVWRTKLHLLWMLGAGALLGAAGLL